MSTKNKSKYKSYPVKRKHTYRLEAGLSGFICTCSSKVKERDCVREAYSILNEFADEVFGKEETAVKETPGDDEEDIDNELKKEIDCIKTELKKNPDARRFQVVDSDVNGIVFIRSTVPDPVKLAHTIVTSLAKVQKSKHLLRLLPVEATCKAYIEDICKTCDTLFNKYFCGEEKTFVVIYNHRKNDSIKRDDLIKNVAALVYKKNEKHKADLKQPQLAVLIEIMRTICCISVVPDFYVLKKYNLMELAAQNCESSDKNEEETQNDDETKTED